MLFLFITGFNYIREYSKKYIDDRMDIEKTAFLEKFTTTFDAMYNKTVYLLNSEDLNEIVNINTFLDLQSSVELNDIIKTTKLFYSPDSTEIFNIYTTNQSIKNLNYVIISKRETIEKLCGDDGIKTVIEKKDGTNYLSIYRQWTNTRGKTKDYFHAISLSIPLSKIYTEKESKNEDFFFFHKSGVESCCIVAPKSKDIPDLYKYTKNKQLKNYFVKETLSPQTDGMFYTFMNIKGENSKMRMVGFTFMVTYVFLIILVIFVMNCLSAKLTVSLTNIISDIELDNIQKPMTQKNNVKEFNIIHNKLYELSTDMNDMLKIELQTLSEKIAPHFLYNNLSAIKMISNDKNVENIVNILIEYYRNVFQKSTTYVAVSSEVENLRTYISLLKFAYDQDFKYSEEIFCDINSIVILSGIIQPLIENAFIHSINNSNDKDAYITLKITQKNSKIKISVINNHCNEPLETLKRSAKKDDNSSALSIIRKRIQLYYNENYGMDFELNDDVLTTTLNLPYKTPEEL